MEDEDDSLATAATEALNEEEQEPDTVNKSGAKEEKKKKGSWKNINHEPVNYELHPCLHRWRKLHPKGPCIQYKQIRWVLVPLSDRLKQLAMPLLRRLLALWLEFGDKMSPEMRARLMAFICENYGLSPEFLEQILEEARKAREKGEKKPKKKKRKRRRRKRKRGKKKKAKPKEKPKKKSKKKSKEKPEKESGLLFKRRKPGKLPLDWPYKMGSKFILSCISFLSRDPDEDYNSRATEYFDVQSMAILKQFCHFLDMELPDPEKPTQYGEAMVIMALNLSDWIAKYVTTPAQAIPDDKVEEYLDLAGVKPKKPKPVKPKKEHPPPKPEKGKKKKEEKKVEPEVVTEVQRNWSELKAPVYVPEKSRISKRKNQEEWERSGGEKEEQFQTDDETEGVPRWKEVTLDDIKKEFLEYINWYNPWEPEFMYFGPRKTPDGVAMFKIYDADSDEVPADLRVLNWNQIEYGFKDNYSFIPAPVPQYYPSLRPLRPVRLENLEKSGIPREIIKRNLRFFSPWYLMSKALKPPPPPPPTPPPVSSPPPIEAENEMDEYAGEYELPPTTEPENEEVIEDEMLKAPKEPPIQDAIWGDYTMTEQIEILCHLLHLMASTPDLTLEYVFELLEEFCEAVECAEAFENSTDENKLLRKKRTIILEQYFFEFFGKKFRDHNDRTSHYMRTLCSRCAYYIQLLYEYTARILWELQSQQNPPSPIPSRPETPDDPDALRDWDEWLAWLMKVTKTCDEWAGWISETVNEAEKKATKKKREFIGPDGRKVPLTAEEWFGWKAQIEQKVFEYRSSKKQICKESPYYLEKAKHILPVKHRQKICQWMTEEYGEAEEEEDENTLWTTIKDGEMGEETQDETEWEDVGEIEE